MNFENEKRPKFVIIGVGSAAGAEARYAMERLLLTADRHDIPVLPVTQRSKSGKIEQGQLLYNPKVDLAISKTLITLFPADFIMHHFKNNQSDCLFPAVKQDTVLTQAATQASPLPKPLKP